VHWEVLSNESAQLVPVFAGATPPIVAAEAEPHTNVVAANAAHLEPNIRIDRS
jgi:hypothetical protein